jgi:ADP-ribose pyrophosphatase YjhB (NUDIX family)
MIEHHIQKDILLRLSKAESLRFSELKPDDLESNAFMYHLRQLQKQKLVEKIDEGYRLSDDGLAYIDGFSFHNLKPRKQPKLISILAVRNPNGKWLLAQRKYQPYIHQFMLPSGKQHIGEGPEAHVKRELTEKLGLELELRRRGLSDIRIYRGDKIITHVTAHIYEGTALTEDLPPETSQFAFAWVGTENESVPLLAGTRQIMEKLVSEKDLFFLSLDVQDN